MARLIRTTYQIVTPESAEDGDFAESGWDNEDGIEMRNPSEAIKFLKDNGASNPSSSHFHVGIWYSNEGEQDMHDGSEKTESFHLDGFTERAQRMIWDAIMGEDTLKAMCQGGINR